ncbi:MULTISPECIES: antibiotic biosynthesis monooxygenase family protein [Streptomyces]|jgi:heme-degrading monooxygenase HmoA|uniref:Antibiotic biosynthesis monooxygenase n=1 Tax=Streptomyces hydrogenans TaxID=1873719 RepID=A0ABQ3PB09_9ACTN|nr:MULTISPECIES: antibiotic biosynthesis monooxygenase family protein [Streptomyces]GHG08524.1 antibiotic biosynthesis monooxygenase [Streptomyces hydrogenans]GHI22211.1 antibiotic biosynthesis monooxygenase [Streptomyces hydrogenans]
MTATTDTIAPATSDAATTGPYRVMLRMEIRPGMTEDFEKVWLAIGDSVTSHPASLGQTLARATDEENVYYIVSDWTDEPSFRLFETSDRHLEHRQQLHPFRSQGSMVTMQVTARVDPSGEHATHADWEAAR